MAEHIEGDWKNFTFRMVQQEDYPKILEHLRNNFCKDEPIQKLLGPCESKANDICNLAQLFMEEGLSFVVMEKSTNKLVAVRITYNHSKDFKMEELAGAIQSKELLRVLPSIEKLEEDSQVFKKYPHVDGLADLFCLSVDREFRGQGLATETYKRLIPFLKAKGFKLVKSIFTSPYTWKIVQKDGFQEMCRLKFNEFRDADNQLVFPNASDEGVSIYGAREI